ncbi:MAG: hypothetical protein EA364_01065 [Balneolaceae bacterium]|nr:MAG: hypothetical protein EA364_01065 [Balneolaceae bacterium]
MYSQIVKGLLPILLLIIAGCSTTPTSFSDEPGQTPGVIPGFQYSIDKTTHVRLWVQNSYRVTVAVLVDEVKTPGNYYASVPLTDLSGRRLTEGMYTYHIKTQYQSSSGVFYLHK